MYCKHFGFDAKPFDVTPDAEFLYWSRRHREALAALTYGVRERRGFIVVVGDVGTGKTTLLNCLMERLSPDTVVASVSNTNVSFEQLLQLILLDLGLAEADEQLTKVQAIDRLNRLAVDALAEGRNVALLIDEAQNLDSSSLENLRLLSNLETQKLKLFQIVLCGQPELDNKLTDFEKRQLRQRVSIRRLLGPLSRSDTFRYIAHRLAVAGCNGRPPFSRKAMQSIWKYSGGTPRKINILCDNAFITAFAINSRRVSASMVKEAAGDLGWSANAKECHAGGNDKPRKAPGKATTAKFAPGYFKLAAVLLLIACFIFVGMLAVRQPNRGSGFLFAERIDDSAASVPSLKSNLNKTIVRNAIAGLRAIVPEGAVRVFSAFNHLDFSPKAHDRDGMRVVVKPGDDFAQIIKTHYGRCDEALIKLVLDANGKIEDPARIVPGLVIYLPDLKIRKALPSIENKRSI